MYSTIEKLDGCEYCLEIIIVPLEERITRTNFFGNNHFTAERLLKQRTASRSPVKTNTFENG